MTTVALYHLKGGVGKTTAAVNLACVAAKDGNHVLLWDLDPQGAAGFYLSRTDGAGKSGALARGEIKLANVAQESALPGLDVLPSRFSYRKLDLRLADQPKARGAIRRALQPVSKTYQWVFLDCPPGVSLLAENIFRAADVILVPLIPSPLSIRSFEEISVFVDRQGLSRVRLVPFYSMVEKRKRIHRETMEVFSAREPGVCLSVIPALSDIEAMGVTRRPVAYFRPRSLAGMAYRALWNELQEKAQERL
ncbi:MAG TPA: AAA family ATPase [Spirochaetia bacterium]|nr:AAA family ATPase [Spirochaetia bacterium]